MDEIQTRLKDSSEKCIQAYTAWKDKKSDVELRGALQEAVHELRKVSARLEIEIATSERDQMTQKPIPVPPHRSARRRGPSQSDDQDDADDSKGNMNTDAPAAKQANDSSNEGGMRPKMEVKKRRRVIRKPDGSTGE